MLIEYIGHACFYVSDDCMSVVFDPFGNIGYEQKIIRADYCICSHFHYDHFSTDHVNVKEIITKDNCKQFDFLRAVDSYHDECHGAKRGENTIFKVNFKDFSVCHMGDIGQPFSREICKKIGKTDILLIPVGGVYTVDALEALKYVNQINPKIVIPMHYSTKRSDIDIFKKDEFLKLFSSKDVIKKGDTFNIDELPEKMEVYDLDDSNF